MSFSHIDGNLREDKDRGYWCWITRDGDVIPVPEMADTHLRNAALFLMGMGYQKCVADNPTRIVWLSILRKEWERRMDDRARKNSIRKLDAAEELTRALNAYQTLVLEEGRDD